MYSQRIYMDGWMDGWTDGQTDKQPDHIYANRLSNINVSLKNMSLTQTL